LKDNVNVEQRSGLLGLYLVDFYLGGLYSGALIFGGGAYIWNEVSVSICGGLIFGGGGGLIVGGLRYIAPMCVAMIWVGFDGVHSLLDISAAFVSIFLT
jgi:hypothetical protein